MKVKTDVWDTNGGGSVYRVNDSVSLTIRNHVWDRVRFPVADRVLDISVHTWRQVREEYPNA